VDISERALKIAEQNVEINGFDKNKHKTFVQNCFDFLKEMPENYYDLIVIDPPAFAKSQDTVKNAARGYKELNLRAFNKIKSGGIIFTFSCSQRVEPELFKKIIFSAAADAKRKIRILHQLSQGIDHPINIFHPETEYLKGLVLLVE
jgi:23S rRNA (cytosine1962-C5)-methyltransferase